MRHPGLEEILQFVSGSASIELAERVYSHLDECEICTERCEVARRARGDFDRSWSNFVEELAVAGHVARSSPRPRQSAALGLVVQGVMDAARKLTTAAGNLASTLSGENAVVFVPAYTGVGDARREIDVAARSRRASELCAESKPDLAREELGEVARLDPAAAAAVRLDLVVQGRACGQIHADARNRSVAILVSTESIGDHTLWATLHAGEEDSTPRRMPLRPVEGADYCLAEFTDVPDGFFRIDIQEAE